MNDLIDQWSARTGMTRADAAAALGVGYGRLCTWLRGDQVPRPARMRALAELLGVEPSECLRMIRAANAAHRSRLSGGPPTPAGSEPSAGQGVESPASIEVAG